MSKIKLQSEYDDLDNYKYDNGDIVYYRKNTNICHNPYGPAFITKDGNKYYFINNKLHRLDGPALIWPNGEEEYWINYDQLSKKEFKKHPERLKFINKEYLICII